MQSEGQQHKIETRLWARQLLDAYKSWAKSVCAAIYWTDQDGNDHNGTMTILETPSCLLGITNSHVADAIIDSASIPDSNLKVGSAPFEPSRLIAKHKELDLATFELPRVYLPATGQYSATVTEWPPRIPNEGDVLFMGGFPAIYRVNLGNSVEFQFAWFAGKANSSRPGNIGIVLDIENSISLSEDRMPPNINLGGWSGGPVFRATESGFIERIELVGIIYQYHQGFEIAFAHTLESLNADGTFAD